VKKLVADREWVKGTRLKVKGVEKLVADREWVKGTR
jgi:hypothetical protein